MKKKAIHYKVNDRPSCKSIMISPLTSYDVEKVTCKNCLNSLKLNREEELQSRKLARFVSIILGIEISDGKIIQNIKNNTRELKLIELKD